MESGITAVQSFQIKMKERIRDSIGELMPDEALAEIVAKAVQKAFFEDHVIGSDRYLGRTEIKPSWAVQIVKELLEASVKESVRAWLTENNGKMQQIIAEQLNGGIIKALVNAVTETFQGSMMSFQSNLQQDIQQIH